VSVREEAAGIDAVAKSILVTLLHRAEYEYRNGESVFRIVPESGDYEVEIRVRPATGKKPYDASAVLAALFTEQL